MSGRNAAMVAHEVDPEEPVSPDPQKVDADQYDEFVASVVLKSVDLVALDAERRAAGEAARTSFELEGGFELDGTAIHYRFTAHGRLSDDADADCGRVSASVIVTIQAPAAPDESFAEQFGSTSAVMIAHPYLREAIASTAQRLGFPGVLLPLLVQKPLPGRSVPRVSSGSPVAADASG